MKNTVSLILTLMVSMFSFTSCQTKTDPEQKGVYCSFYDLLIEDLDFKLYDFTVTYYDVRLECINTSVMTGQLWTYSSSTEEPKFDKFVLKLEAKLKPDAADIVKDLEAAGKSLETGYTYTFKAGYYEDGSMNGVKKTLVSEHESFKHMVSPDKFHELLSTPSISIIDITE